MLPNTAASDEDRAVIAGHYVFAKKEFIEIKAKAQAQLKNIEIDEILKYEVKKAILRYMKPFRLVK
jgi:hypothetical protein